MTTTISPPETAKAELVRPLSHWMLGTLRVHFQGGTVLTKETTADLAVRLRKTWNAERGQDALRWPDGWLVLAGERVDAMQWSGHADYGFPLSLTYRQAQARNGHSNGVLASLVDIWEEGSERAYSADALILLSRAACDLEWDDWEPLARMLEGEDGALLTISIQDRLSDGETVTLPDAGSGLTFWPKAPSSDDIDVVEPPEGTPQSQESTDEDGARAEDAATDVESAVKTSNGDVEPEVGGAGDEPTPDDQDRP